MAWCVAALISIVATAVAAMSSLAGAAAAGTEAHTACEFSSVERTLTIRLLDGTEFLDSTALERSGDEIAVIYADADDLTGERLACTGGTATVTNTDSIAVIGEPGAEGPSLFLNLAVPLSPGATDEGDGSSEIEVVVEFAAGGTVFIDGTPGPDALTLGETDHGRGIDLNPPEAIRDADLVTNDRVQVVPFLASGADTIRTPRGGGAFSGPYPGKVFAFMGNGGDRVEGTTRGDSVTLGGGRDRVQTGKGGDFITARDHERDRLDCGPGFDFPEADRKDRLRHCEDVSGSNRRPPTLRRGSRASQVRSLRAAASRARRTEAGYFKNPS